MKRSRRGEKASRLWMKPSRDGENVSRLKMNSPRLGENAFRHGEKHSHHDAELPNTEMEAPSIAKPVQYAGLKTPVSVATT